MTTTTYRRSLWPAAAACAVVCAGAAQARSATDANALAQVASATAQEDDAAANPDVVITGSRIDRAGFDAPTPTTIIGGDALLVGNRPSIAQVLNDLPQFRATTTPTTNFSGTASGSSPADLRGLGTTRTLTLLNGRRFTGSGDLNTVPQGLISRVEVVTGGASAAWGSGAVGGVVNILLDTKLDGLAIGATTGVSSRGDAFRYGVDGTFGTRFAGGRGHFMVGVQYFDDEGVLDRDSRPNLGSTTLYTNPAGSAHAFVIAPDVNYSNASVGGLITSGVLAGQTFNRDGTLRPFIYGNPRGSAVMVGGEGTSLRDETALAAPYRRLNGYARLSFAVGDATVWTDASYSRMRAQYPFYAESNRDNITISRDNPFLPVAVRNRLIAAGQTSFRFGRVFEDYGYRTYGYTRETVDAAIGVDGSFAGGDWRYSAYYGHGELSDDRGYLNQKVTANFNRAIDVVANPAGGAPICRVALTDPTTACRPLNLFGEGNADPAAVAYAFSSGAHVRNTTKLDTAMVSLRGDPFSLWAGPVSVAVGAEARWESIASSDLDPLSAAQAFTTFNFSLINGGFNVKEGFGEVAVPLLDQPFSKIEFSAAGRYSHYSNTGNVTSWKLGVTDRVFDDLLLRVSTSRDIRSGSLTELFNTRSTTQSNIADPTTKTTYQIVTFGGGNPNLAPEIGRTTTIGGTFSPSSVPGLNLSVDYFDIRIKGAIATLSGQDIVTRCANGNAALCSQIVRANGVITTVFATFVNLAEYHTNGLDFEASYDLPLSTVSASLPGKLRVRGLATYVDSLTTDDGVSRIEYVGDVGEAVPFGTPHWRGNLTVTYDDSVFGADARVRYVGGGLWNHLLDIENNAISAKAYLDLGARVRIDGLTLSANVTNVFDKDAPPTTTGQIHYDQMGRYFSMAARIAF
ncbi:MULTISPECIES: TonB-dependent receptor [Sphingomonas]|uniref:TonB-dependent receptor n=1 Tax=Sphingomonas adhaesiva TaxID=28212 RepID=A0A2A4I5B9_9SPHN|nr:MULTISPECIES: TonB-dependent receptor [Sphingomonas]PCG13298.1 TonB-dependent receptor [Sphingomonas adhaesiva]PZU75307.1 MAG: TonB-dependent receptor [Sphingomonas sp.]